MDVLNLELFWNLEKGIKKKIGALRHDLLELYNSKISILNVKLFFLSEYYDFHFRNTVALKLP